MEAVVATAFEVACALAYLHSNNVVHGDLSSWNIMLCSSGARVRGAVKHWQAGAWYPARAKHCNLVPVQSCMKGSVVKSVVFGASYIQI